MEEREYYTIKQVSEILGTSTAVLRYFCKHGLVRGVRRTRAGYRAFSREQVDWMQTLVGLKKCGLQTQELKRYAKLHEHGNATRMERKAMLETREQQLLQESREIHENIGYLEELQAILEQE